ncbi:hypothetical protein AB0L82_26125 [Nocardia sp. NPDC052001]|uniref:hypothetical protein n=1 Tax=Nocardia sp. NPDC052001 TaxID=3154853 RepID=UPI003445BD8B
MFERWPDEFEPPLRRVVDPPTPVTVDLAAAIPTHPGNASANALPMRVRAGGLDMTGTAPGLLHGWARTRDGAWIGLVEFAIETGNRRGTLEMRQWCSQRAITPR